MKDDEVYDLVTVKRARGGIVRREHLAGKEISVKSQFRIEPGDFLISKRQIVHGACALVPKEFAGSIVSNEYAVLETDDALDSRFLAYLSHTPYFQQTCFHSSIGVHIEKVIFKLDRWFRWEFNIPPLAEQKKIVEILSTWDGAVKTTKKLLVNAEAQKRTIMQQLLTGKKRLKGFEGREWVRLTLGELGEPYGGLSGKSADDFGQGKPFITYMTVFSRSRVDVNAMQFVEIGPKEKQHRVRKGDIFFTVSSETPDEVGMSSVLLDDVGEAYLNSFCFGYRLNSLKLLRPEYARYLLRGSQFRRDIRKLAQGATRYNLSKRQLMKLHVELPSLEEQEQIVRILDAADSMVDACQRDIEMLLSEKSALMQQLLTGKRRVRP